MAVKLKEVLKKDLVRDKVDPTVKVDDMARLYADIRDFVLTEELAADALKLVRTLSGQLQELQRGSIPQAVVDGCWLSGFFGTGKSHLAKLMGALVRNPMLSSPNGPISALDHFYQTHEPITQAERDLKAEIMRLSRIGDPLLIVFEITAAKKGSHDSIPDIFLRKFFEAVGYASTLWIARIERDLEERGLYARLKEVVAAKGMGNWDEERQEAYRAPAILIQALPEIAPEIYRGEEDAKLSIETAEDEKPPSAEDLAMEIRRYLDRPRPGAGKGGVPLAFFVVDEVGQFIADDKDRIEEMRSVVERGAVEGNGRIFFVMTSQEDLAGTVGGVIKGDQMNKLNARFGVKIDLKSQNVAKIVRDRLLIKTPTGATQVAQAFREWEGPLSEIENIQTTGVTYPKSDPQSFTANYPLLGYQVELAQDILATMRGPRLSGTERTIIQIVQDAVGDRADQDLGVLIPFDAVFDANESELSSNNNLGTHGVREILRSDKRLGWSASVDFAQPSRVLKVLYLIQRLEEKRWIPQTPDTIAKLMTDHVEADLSSFKEAVKRSLDKLAEASMVSFDGDAYHFLSPEEREIEQYYQERKSKVRINHLQRDIKERGRTLLAANKITDGTQQYQIKYGASGQGLFGFEAKLDGEVVSPPGAHPLGLELFTPLSGVKPAEIRTANLAQGPSGKTVFWLADDGQNFEMEDTLKQVRALQETVAHYQPKADRDELANPAKEALRKKATDLARAEKRADELLVETFKKGRVLFSGDEKKLPAPDADTLKKVLPVVGKTVISALFDRFDLADKDFDDSDGVFKAIFNPAGNLAAIDGIRDLGMVDAQGHVMPQSGIVTAILDCLAVLEAEKSEVKAEDVRDTLQDIPYGWPRGVIQLGVALLFRSGLVELTHKGDEFYDYRQFPDAPKVFPRITAFDALKIRRITEVLTPGEIQDAYLFCKNTLEIAQVRESVNDIFLQFRDYRTGLDHLKTRIADFVAQGLPLPNPVQENDSLIEGSRDKNRPQELVRWVLDNQTELKDLHEQAKGVRSFLENNLITLQLSIPLIRRAEASQTLKQADREGKVGEAVAQLNHLMENREVVSKWTDFQAYRGVVENAYRAAYESNRAEFDRQVESLEKTMRAREEFQRLPGDKQALVASAWFGPGGKARAGVSRQSIGTLKELLNADQATSLDALAGRIASVGAMLPDILADIEEHGKKRGDPPPKPRVRTWRPKAISKGMVIRKDEIEAISLRFSEELEAQFEESIEEVIIQ
jgi:hypothetical protein